MSKPFFYRLDAGEFLAAVVTIPEEKRADWVLRLALDLVACTHNTEFSEKLIDEARNFKEKKALAGKMGMESRYNKPQTELNSVTTEPNTVITRESNDITSSSNSNSNNSSNNKEEDKTFSASLDAGQENEDFYLTAKKRKLTGERLTTFNQFMDTFGDKRGRAQAADVWIDLKITRKVFDDIIRGATRYAKQRATIQAQGHTPKMAQGWLSGRRWEDEQPEAQRKLEVCL